MRKESTWAGAAGGGRRRWSWTEGCGAHVLPELSVQSCARHGFFTDTLLRVLSVQGPPRSTSGEVNLPTGGVVPKAVHSEPLRDVNGIELQRAKVEVLKQLQNVPAIK